MWRSDNFLLASPITICHHFMSPSLYKEGGDSTGICAVISIFFFLTSCRYFCPLLPSTLPLSWATYKKRLFLWPVVILLCYVAFWNEAGGGGGRPPFTERRKTRREERQEVAPPVLTNRGSSDADHSHHVAGVQILEPHPLRRKLPTQDEY